MSLPTVTAATAGDTEPNSLKKINTLLEGARTGAAPLAVSGGGGGGGPATIADGADVAEGSKTQAAATDGSVTSWSVIQLLKGIFALILGKARTTAFSANTAASGTVAAGAQSVLFVFSADFVGTIKTVAIDVTSSTNPFGSLPLSAQNYDTLDAIAWTRTAGTLYILTVT